MICADRVNAGGKMHDPTLYQRNKYVTFGYMNFHVKDDYIERHIKIDGGCEQHARDS